MALTPTDGVAETGLLWESVFECSPTGGVTHTWKPQPRQNANTKYPETRGDGEIGAGGEQTEPATRGDWGDWGL